MGAIKCFGDFWSRKQVDWEPSLSGGRRELMGHAKRDKTAVNFRYQKGVYVLFTEPRQIIYIGQVGKGEIAGLYGRLRKHTRSRLRERWTHFSWFGIKAADGQGLAGFEESPADVSTVLAELEGILIHLVEPPLNRQGAQWRGASEYLQVPLKLKGIIPPKDVEADDDDPESYDV